MKTSFEVQEKYPYASVMEIDMACANLEEDEEIIKVLASHIFTNEIYFITNKAVIGIDAHGQEPIFEYTEFDKLILEQNYEHNMIILISRDNAQRMFIRVDNDEDTFEAIKLIYQFSKREFK